MNSLFKEFFWTPDETLSWVGSVIREYDLWVVFWVAGEEQRLITIAELPRVLPTSDISNAVNLFLGSFEISPPLWIARNGHEQLDFSNSYAVQLSLPLVATDNETLLQGRLSMFNLRQYNDMQKAGKLQELFRVLVDNMKKDSDHNYSVVQHLDGGKKKVWKDMLVGKEAMVAGIKHLKQFSGGCVEFMLEKREG